MVPQFSSRSKIGHTNNLKEAIQAVRNQSGQKPLTGNSGLLGARVQKISNILADDRYNQNGVFSAPSDHNIIIDSSS